ncbi:MAG: alpha/beta hydrolase family protein [Caulobacteraceae bacterium]
MRNVRASRLSATVVLTANLAAFASHLAAQPAGPSPIQVASEQERRRELSDLGLKDTRPGAKNGDPTSPFATNYDEAKANPTPLPDPLIGRDGKRVTSAREWKNVRRPQIVNAMEDALYGRRPAALPKVTWTVTSSRRIEDYGVPAIEKTLDGALDNAAAPEIAVHIKAWLVTPEDAVKAGRKTPVVLAVNWYNPPAGFPKDPNPDYRALILKRGWSYVIYDPTSVQADNGAGLTKGVIGLVNKGQPRKAEDWGAMSAWAWGASRVVDALAHDPNVDASHVAIFGHSRYGKASLVAMAYDERFKAGFISSSGAGGAAPYRRHWGEQVENVAAGNEYHWMGERFLRYAADPLSARDLPIDANAVIALAAPRAVFVGAGRSTADGDGWVDPHGMFLAEASAGEVWGLLGKPPLSKAQPAPMALSDSGPLAYRQHDQGHTPGPNWPYFLDFADRAFSKG